MKGKNKSEKVIKHFLPFLTIDTSIQSFAVVVNNFLSFEQIVFLTTIFDCHSIMYVFISLVKNYLQTWVFYNIFTIN